MALQHQMPVFFLTHSLCLTASFSHAHTQSQKHTYSAGMIIKAVMYPTFKCTTACSACSVVIEN